MLQIHDWKTLHHLIHICILRPLQFQTFPAYGKPYQSSVKSGLTSSVRKSFLLKHCIFYFLVNVFCSLLVLKSHCHSKLSDLTLYIKDNLNITVHYLLYTFAINKISYKCLHIISVTHVF